MRWFRRRRNADVPAVVERAERLTGTVWSGVASETCDLTDTATVRSWLAGLSANGDQQVFVHRHWGVLAVVPDKKMPTSVVLSDGEDSWFAVPPGAGDNGKLTPEQIDRVVLASLDGPSRPQWPDWRPLT